MFIDEAIITVRAGNGGNGCMSFRREKYVPKGGPDGGDGGTGGNIIFIVDENETTLTTYATHKEFHGTDGEKGFGKNMAGKGGDDVYLRVPKGTIIRDNITKDLICDMTEHGETFVICQGGRGGYGNAHFASSVRQIPRFAEFGDTGQERVVHLELKLVADVGIIGLPNAGKSTLISNISNARPKIADYPFTTLAPNLGIVLHKGTSFVVSDVPGLISGASEGKGLGHDFLKHVERTRILLHLVDASAFEASIENYKVIRKELETFSANLASKEEIIVLSKADLLDPDSRDMLVQAWKDASIQSDHPIFIVSALTHDHLSELLDYLVTYIANHPLTLSPLKHRVRQYRPKEYDPMLWHIDTKQSPPRITGRRIEQIVRMTDMTNEEAVHRIYDVLEKIRARNALEKAGLTFGDHFMINDKEFSYIW